MIQKLFTDFHNENIIKCNKRGILGSYIEYIDNGNYWKKATLNI